MSAILGGVATGLLSAFSVIGAYIFEVVKYIVNLIKEISKWFLSNPEKALMSLGVMWILLSP
ncbi:MAG: hypothetical protein QXW71_05220 [Thermoplasmata archaeon]